ncbi:MAG: hydrogenase maturation protease [Elusimicrobiota bacterium]|jgi:hydrogenase 3 maturation protease|nr:hydrogenase maturation protease [Elusimicrobiota bacterium]
MLTLPPLKNQKVAFLAVGNPLRGDDAFGPLVYGRLKQRASADFLPLDGGELPESQISPIKRFNPAVLIMADAALMPGEPAGALKLLNGQDIINPALSTHTLPLSVMLKFLKQDLPNLKIIFIAAKAESADFAAAPSKAIEAAAQAAALAVLAAL